MGVWQMEVGKMAIYIAFPVVLFHWFNAPGTFSDQLEQFRAEKARNLDFKGKELYEALVEETNRKQSMLKFKE